MSRAVKTFIAKVEDKLGWDYPQAFIAIRFASESSQVTFESLDCKGAYIEANEEHIITYTASFWGTKQMQVSGKSSRPLFDKVISEPNADPTFNEVFTVDLDNPQIIQVLNSNAQDKLFTIIELDLTRRFK